MIDKSQINRLAYSTPEALEKYSSYNLYRPEKYLFEKYYKVGDSVLDLACGGGRTTVRLFELGMKVKGEDLSEPLIEMAGKRFPYIDFEVGTYTHLRHADSSFDHVLISHNGLDYAYPTSNRRLAIQESVRVLKPRGTFIFSSHNIKSLYMSPYYFLNMKRLVWKLKNSMVPFRSEYYVLDLGMYTYFGSPELIVGQVEEFGLRCEEIIGFRNSTSPLFNKYVSPYIHYVFRKP